MRVHGDFSFGLRGSKSAPVRSPSETSSSRHLHCKHFPGRNGPIGLACIARIHTIVHCRTPASLCSARQWSWNSFIRSFASGSPAASASRPSRSCAAGREIAAGQHTLIAAPTGSGKTLAAFLVCLDRLLRQVARRRRCPTAIEVVYVSPLKALSNDIQRNLQAPLAEIAALAAEAGLGELPIRTAVRTGDTPASRAAGDAPQAAAHPGHHARIAVPAAHLGQEPREAADGEDGDRR